MAKATTGICLVDVILFSFFLVAPRAFAAAAAVTDTLCGGRNITDGETLVSADGTFTLGFFSPGVSAKRYLGILFTVSPDAVCWVANRDSPLNVTSGVLAISDAGSLVLLDGSGGGHVAWSSNSPYAASVEARLSNSGNLVTVSPGEISYGYVSKPGAPLTRSVVLDTGVVKRLVWEATSRTWQTYFQGPRDVCDAYAKCGAFGLCDANAPSTSFCGCLRGFSPTSPAAWAMKDASGGCRRNVPLRCGNTTTTDGFALVQGVKLPDTHNASVDTGITVEECRARCVANCSCLAYAAADIRGGGGGSGCVIWTGDIVDLRYVDQGQDLFLRLAQSELDEGRSRKFHFLAVISPISATIIMLVLLLAIRCRGKHKISEGIPHNPATTVPSVDLHKVKAATGNFSQSHVIGQGGFGIVYKGQLPDGRVIAVKRLHQSTLTKKGKKDFTREVEVMARLRHGNLLRLLAYCSEGSERVLIYDYMSNRSLDLYIFGDSGLRLLLNWRKRLDIIHGIANGIAYLHEGSGECVIHRDLKPPNVLLDDSFRPKIADFGTAKLLVADQPEPSNLTVVVSPGYASPEYAWRGEMTLKCDVYSFGVVLLETLSGQRNGPMYSLLPHAWELWEQDRVMSLLDATIGLPLSVSGPDHTKMEDELARCVQIGLLCVQDAPEERPAMSAVVAMLTSKSSRVDRPKRPGVHGGRSRPPLRESELLGATDIDDDLT
uniref:non-specific serine/threonine protein kinase n=1 Tax=Oryza glumipatula TaxID=40148 RepID=A0A0D9ZRA4_9ORYZ